MICGHVTKDPRAKRMNVQTPAEREIGKREEKTRISRTTSRAHTSTTEALEISPVKCFPEQGAERKSRPEQSPWKENNENRGKTKQIQTKKKKKKSSEAQTAELWSPAGKRQLGDSLTKEGQSPSGHFRGPGPLRGGRQGASPATEGGVGSCMPMRAGMAWFSSPSTIPG